VQKFTDESLTVHDDCGGRLRKVFSPVGIVFKGSGFYRTDSRKSDSSASVPSASKPGSDSAASSSSSGDSSGLPVLVEVGRRLVRVVVLFRQLRVVVVVFLE
jgi:predicted nucleic acid-binding Zn ribbon protein